MKTLFKCYVNGLGIHKTERPGEVLLVLVERKPDCSYKTLNNLKLTNEQYTRRVTKCDTLVEALDEFFGSHFQNIGEYYAHVDGKP